MPTTYQPGAVGETLVGSGQFTTAITAAQIAAGAVVIKGAPGRLCSVLVTTTTTASQAITFFDNASAGSGAVIGQILGGTAAANLPVVFNMPAQAGITIAQNASLAAGAVTVSWS